MMIKCLVKGHNCDSKHIWTRDLMFESLGSYPLSQDKSNLLIFLYHFQNKQVLTNNSSYNLLVPSSRTDFFVDMSGQISSWWWQLSTKQWSGNKYSDVPTKIQTPSYTMDHRDWPGKQWRAERQTCRCTPLTARISQTVKPFWRLILSIFFFLCILSFSK